MKSILFIATSFIFISCVSDKSENVLSKSSTREDEKKEINQSAPSGNNQAGPITTIEGQLN